MQNSLFPQTNETAKRSFLARGGLWVIGQAVLMAGVFFLGLIFHSHAPWPRGVWPGGLALGLGGLIAILGVGQLRTRLTPFPEPTRHSFLVQQGIYGLVRHPLYASIIVSSLGWGLFQRSWPAVALMPVLLVFFDAKARHEERLLRQRFPEYDAYAKRVARFIPFIY